MPKQEWETEIEDIEEAKKHFPQVEERDLPIRVIQKKTFDGRVMVSVFDCRDALRLTRG